MSPPLLSAVFEIPQRVFSRQPFFILSCGIFGQCHFVANVFRDDRRPIVPSRAIPLATTVTPKAGAKPPVLTIRARY